MGAFTTKPDITIKDEPGWEPGERITIKGVVAAEDMEAMAVATVAMGTDGKPVVTSKTSMVASLQCMIIDWMLKGDNNTPVPLYEGTGRNRRKRLEVIAKLPQEYMGPVMVEIGKLTQESQLEEEDQQSFLTGVNGHSKVS